MAIGTGVGAAETPSVVAAAPARGRKARRLRIPRSPKVVIGVGMLVFFVLLAVIGPLVAPYDPSASLSSTNGVPQSPSAAHWLGTTQTQQDLLSQLLVGGRRYPGDRAEGAQAAHPAVPEGAHRAGPADLLRAAGGDRASGGAV